MPVQIDAISEDFFHNDYVELSLLRLDLFDPDIPGNKFFKMKYNIEEMRLQGKDQLVTFGGAYSNHIAATAAAGKKFGFRTIGIIRGEASNWHNHTLAQAEKDGMHLKFIDRMTYRDWKKGEVDLDDFIGWKDYYLLPEGGSNALAVKGCKDIHELITGEYNVIACPVGSGATMAGLIAGSRSRAHILGYSALKGGEFLKDDVRKLLLDAEEEDPGNWSIELDFHFGGFAKVSEELIAFYHQFLQKTGIELDLIYTAKMMWGLKDLIRRGSIKKGMRILAVHTGGQQGNRSLISESIRP